MNVFKVILKLHILVAKSTLETLVFIPLQHCLARRNTCGCAGADKLFAILDFALISR